MKKNINLRKILPAIVLVFVCLPAFAIEGKLMVSTFPNFFDRLYKNYSEVPLASIPPTQQVYKQQTFYMIPFISGFSLNAQGKADVTYTLTIKYNGTKVLERTNVRGLAKAVNDTMGVFICETVINHTFADTAKNGTYTVEALITDNVSKHTAFLQETISVAAYKYQPRRFANNDSFYQWQNYYYEGYDPDREIDGLLFFSQPKMQLDVETTLPLLGFFAEVFKGKKYLLKELEAVFTILDTNERLTAIQVLNLADYMPQSLQKKFTKEEQAYYKGVKGYGLPIVPDSTVKNPLMLNLLWAKFFATGEYAYAKKIAEALELVQYEGAMTRYQQSQKTEQDQQEVFWETVYQKNVKELLQRLPGHMLFNGYCLYMMVSGEVSPTVARQLERVVAR